MGIGYACLTVGVPNTDYKRCMLKNAEEERLLALIQYNLNSLDHVIEYNRENHINLFRISSDLIAFGSSPANRLPWWDIFDSTFQSIGKKIKDAHMRVSMHPGQYTVLNSNRNEVVQKAIDDLHYHAKVLDCLGLSKEHKIVLHIGGIYNNKKEAMERFVANYGELDKTIKQRLVIENDDKCYTIGEVLDIGTRLKIPVVYDNLHNKINPVDKEKDDYDWIDQCKETWGQGDGQQKIHYAQQALGKNPGAHSDTIDIHEFIGFYSRLSCKDIDIMLEVKDKNLSAIKCIHCTQKEKKIQQLEKEWGRYKYKVLENSASDYIAIRNLLNDKNSYPAIDFYGLIEGALKKKESTGSALNAVLHIWGYFKNSSTEAEKKKFSKIIEEYKQGKAQLKTVKNYLWKMAIKYDQSYLLESYYFLL